MGSAHVMPKSVPTALGPFFDLNPLDENLLAPAPNPELELEPNAEPPYIK